MQHSSMHIFYLRTKGREKFGLVPKFLCFQNEELTRFLSFQHLYFLMKYAENQKKAVVANELKYLALFICIFVQSISFLAYRERTEF